MAELILRPYETISAGAWNVIDSVIPEVLSDESDAHVVYNTNGNQEMLLSLRDIEELEELYSSATITIHARCGGKGPETVRVKLETEGGDVLISEDIALSETTLASFTTVLTEIPELELEDINGLQFRLTGTTDRQVYIAEAFVTLSTDEVVLSGSPIKLTSGLIQLTSGKISL